MPRIARKSDGRRIFTAEFKRKQIDRVRNGEMTLAELSRKLGIARSLLQRWKRLMPSDPSVDGVDGTTRGRGPAIRPLPAPQYIRELELLVGKQTVELELLRAELETLKLKFRTR